MQTPLLLARVREVVPGASYWESGGPPLVEQVRSSAAPHAQGAAWAAPCGDGVLYVEGSRAERQLAELLWRLERLAAVPGQPQALLDYLETTLELFGITSYRFHYRDWSRERAPQPHGLQLEHLQVSANPLEAAWLTLLSQQVCAGLERVWLEAELARRQQLEAGVAHEIGNPLGALLMALDTALENVDSRPAVTRQRLDKALKTVKRIEGITQKLLEQGRAAHAGQVDLDQVVRDTLELMGQVLQKDDIALTLDLHGPAWVTASAAELGQILTNLLLNAKDAVQGAVRKEITIRTGASHERALLEVEDSGPGLSSDVQERVFEPYFTTKPTGTGLGLAVSLELARAHGGTLEVKTGGFALTLPRAPRG